MHAYAEASLTMFNRAYIQEILHRIAAFVCQLAALLYDCMQKFFSILLSRTSCRQNRCSTTKLQALFCSWIRFILLQKSILYTVYIKKKIYIKYILRAFVITVFLYTTYNSNFINTSQIVCLLAGVWG